MAFADGVALGLWHVRADTAHPMMLSTCHPRRETVRRVAACSSVGLASADGYLPLAWPGQRQRDGQSRNQYVYPRYSSSSPHDVSKSSHLTGVITAMARQLLET